MAAGTAELSRGRLRRDWLMVARTAWGPAPAHTRQNLDQLEPDLVGAGRISTEVAEGVSHASGAEVAVEAVCYG